MKGIETAFWAVNATEKIELKTGRSGTLWTWFSAGVTMGTLDDGKDQIQWIKVSCFGETAQCVATTFQKGDRCYVEGSLKLDNWVDKHGEQRHGLSVSAFKVEKVGVSNLGRNKPRINRQDDHAGPAPYVHSGPPVTASSFAGSAYKREKPRVVGIHDFKDELPI
jgi:single-strand DNA-binding protein